MSVFRIFFLIAFSCLSACSGSVGDPGEQDGHDGQTNADGDADSGAGDADAGDAGVDDGDAGVADSGDAGQPDGGGDTQADGASSTFEGYGAVTEGAASSPNGFSVYHVTKLDDDGSVGTLRDAVSESNRQIVFDLGGTITLDSTMKIEQDYLTIDGLSAPDPGITITHRVGEYYGMLIAGTRRHTHDLVIQGLRFRGVYDIDPVHVVGRAIFTTDGDCNSENCDGGITKLVIDRITLAYASDKFSLWGKVSDVTTSNSFFYGSNKAFLISFYGESYDLIKEKITLHHNLFASNEERNPQLVAWVTDLDIRNNIIYDWLAYGLRIKSVNVGNRGIHSIDANIVNNVFVAGAGAASLGLVFLSDEVDTCTQQGQVIDNSGMGELWVEGNQFPAENCDRYSTVPQARAVPAYAQVSTQAADQLCTQITPVVGAPYRTDKEISLIDEVKTALGCQ